MVVTDIKRLAEDGGYIVFKLYKDETGKYYLSVFNPESYMRWNNLAREVSYEEAMDVYRKYDKKGGYPILVSDEDLDIEDIRAISRRFLVFQEVMTDDYYAMFEHFNVKTDNWEVTLKCNDEFDYVNAIKKFRENPNVIVTKYLEDKNEFGIHFAGCSNVHKIKHHHSDNE